jgi:hypothetical protein
VLPFYYSYSSRDERKVQKLHFDAAFTINVSIAALSPVLLMPWQFFFLLYYSRRHDALRSSRVIIFPVYLRNSDTNGTDTWITPLIRMRSTPESSFTFVLPFFFRKKSQVRI